MSQNKIQENHQEKLPAPSTHSKTAISSRYVIDRPTRTTTPDAYCLKSFDSATSILKELSPIKNSVTFQRERETQSRDDTEEIPKTQAE